MLTVLVKWLVLSHLVVNDNTSDSVCLVARVTYMFNSSLRVTAHACLVS